MSAHQFEPFQTKAKNLLTAIDQAVQTKAATRGQVMTIKQTLDAQLNALAQDMVAFDPKLRLLYLSSSGDSQHLHPGFGLAFGAVGFKDCQFKLHIHVKGSDDLTVTANTCDYQQKYRLNVYQGALNVKEISGAIEDSLLHWLEEIQKSLT